MLYREHRFRIIADDVEAVESLLQQEGCSSYALTSADDSWDLTVYDLDDHPAPLSILAAAGFMPHSAQTCTADDLWQACNLATLAEELAPGIWLVAEGGCAPDGTPIIIRLPAGGGFGDGRHSTTRLAARLLADLDLVGQGVLDLGCGSGVLGILAWRHGATPAFSDVDAFAIDHTRRTCILNNLQEAVIWRSDLLAGIPADAAFDLVVANLYGDFLLPLLAQDRLHAITNHLVLSGISDRLLPAIRAALPFHGWEESRHLGEDGWWALEAVAMHQG